MLQRMFWISVVLLALLVACGETEELSPEGMEEAAVKLELTSAAFEEQSAIPAKHTCDGPDLSPSLAWGDPPVGTKSLALICDDPDAPRGTWVHWVLYDLPPDVSSLAEGVPPDEQLAGGGKQGRNDFGKIGYGGPCPPKGPTHRYFFKLYALDVRLDLPAGATKKELLEAMEGHVLAEGQLMGQYER